MKLTTLSPEERIIKSAKKIFISKGYAGARMQEIADDAGINKAMLHYYYRSKDKLFKMIAFESFKEMIPRLGGLIESEMPVIDKLAAIVHTYIITISENPALPLFMLNELSKQKDDFIDELKSRVEDLPKFDLLFQQIQQEVDDGKIKAISPFQLLLSTLSLAIFPFICRPIFTGLIGVSDHQYDKLLLNREDHIVALLTDVLTP